MWLKLLKFVNWLMFVTLFVACNDDGDTLTPTSGPAFVGGNNSTKNIVNGWSVPLENVLDGGSGKDGIPALEILDFIPHDQASYLLNDDLVIGIKIGDDIKAYPHKILDWHEIANDEVNGIPMVVSLCPLTGTGIAWERTINGSVTTFGVSGLLYNSNLVPYDRQSNSNWSQMLSESVNGNLVCTTYKTHMVVETTWSNWKKMFPSTRVLSTNTGFDRNYSRPPFSSTVTAESGLVFPVAKLDDRLPIYQRVHGIIVKGKAKVYEFSNFDNGLQVLNESFFVDPDPIVIAGSAERNFIVSFYTTLDDGTILSFDPIDNGTNVIMIDNEGSKWNIFGEAVDGPRIGESLRPTQSYMGYWFAWGTFFPGLEIYNGNAIDSGDN